jgi:hypothetical protein
MPVLESAKIRQAMLPTFIDQGILKDPARARCIRPDSWMNVGGQTTADLLEVFDDPRTCPIQVGAVFKDDIHIRIAEHRLSTNGLHVRSRKKAGHDGVGDLVFDNVRKLTSPACVDDHLDVGDVRERIERNMLQGPDTAQGQQ